MDEVWKDIPGYEGRYQVSNMGRVRSFVSPSDGPSILEPNVDRYGYEQIGLYRDGKRHHYTIHKLVAICFLPEPSEERDEINHWNGDKRDNRAKNLEWVTRGENLKHSYEIGAREIPWRQLNMGNAPKGEDSGRSKLTRENVAHSRAIYAVDNISQREIAEMYGVHQSVMGKALRNESWRHVHVVEVFP